MGAKPAHPSTASSASSGTADPERFVRHSRAQQDLEVMHEVVDGVAVGHDGPQSAGTIDDVDG